MKTELKRRRLQWAILLAVLGAATAFADSIQFTTTGTLDPGTPTTTLSAPGAFTLTFVTPVAPVPGSPTIGGSTFSLSVPATLMLGSTTVDSGTITVDFFAGSDGGFEAFIDNGTDTVHFSIDGPQLFSGSLPNVTILPTSYTAAGGFVSYYVDSSGNFPFVGAPSVTATTLTGAPEPGTVWGAGAGLLLVVLKLARRRNAVVTHRC